MGRDPSCSKEEGLNKGAWTAMEDKILTEYIKIHGEGKWRNLPKKAGLRRNGKSCRLRWLNYLRPGIKRGNITNDEEDLIIRLHNLLGNRWSLIAGRLPGRTDNEIKNYWNTIIGKKLQNQKLQLNQPQPPLQIKKSKSPPSLPNVDDDANVICNKVVVPSTHQPQQNTHDLQLFVDDINLAQSTSKFSLEDNNVNNDDSSDLLLDFEMDDQFLSNLLNADFSQLKNFDSGCDQLSLDSDKSLLASDDATKDLAFPSVTSDFEFNWLQIERK